MQIINNVSSSTLPIIIKIIRKYLVINCNSRKLKSAKSYIEEFTVFIKVKIDNLNEFSKEISEKVRKEVKKNKDITKIKTVKKYLLISVFSKLISKNK